MIEVREVVKRYGDHLAVDGVSFRAQPGEIFGLLGPNGAGKSTIIRMIMNILAPDAGRVLFDGRPLAEADKERIGYLPEERGLYQRQTVREVLTYLAALKGVPAARSAAAIAAWLERFELADWRDRRVEQLSKGMAQKVQFIAAVAHDPEIVFFDEPFSGIDPVSTDVLRGALMELARAGKTVLFSTHLMDQAERICERVHIIGRGRTVVEGRLSEVKDRFGTGSIQVELDGDAGFLRGRPAGGRADGLSELRRDRAGRGGRAGADPQAPGRPRARAPLRGGRSLPASHLRGARAAVRQRCGLRAAYNRAP